MPILSMMKNIVYVVVIFTLICSINDEFGSVTALPLFLFGYSLPHMKSRFVSGILLLFFLFGTALALFVFSFKFPSLHWLVLIVSLIQPLILLCMLLGSWLALRSLQATFLYHRIKCSKIIWKNIFITSFISLVVAPFFIGIALIAIADMVFGSEILWTIKPILAQYMMSISCVVMYFVITKFPAVHYAEIEESA